MYTEVNKMYTSMASKAYGIALGGSVDVAGFEGISVFRDILDNL